VGAHVQSGKLRALAVGSSKRSSALPDVPTVAEAGVPGYDMVLWFGVLAPAGTPAGAVNAIHREIVNTAKAPDVRSRLAAQGADLVATAPGEFDAFIKSEIAKWARVVKENGLKVD
jgi:tripartite-type tricarboxylate transporter receptor subunit TctC